MNDIFHNEQFNSLGQHNRGQQQQQQQQEHQQMSLNQMQLSDLALARGKDSLEKLDNLNIRKTLLYYQDVMLYLLF